jgi:hypothetical protein
MHRITSPLPQRLGIDIVAESAVMTCNDFGAERVPAERRAQTIEERI